MTQTSVSPVDSLPFLTPDIPSIAATIKREYSDFRVVEVPAYEPSGDGTHVYFRVEKTGLSTMRAINDIATALGVSSRQIGMAGLKDARGITEQTLSLEHIDPERVKALNIPRIRVLNVSRHTNKIKIGHLRGNKFALRLRDVDPERIDDVRRVCDVLVDKGVPNYFGSQRFGLRGDTWEMGRAALKNDAKTLVDLMIGRPGTADTGKVLQARQLYEKGDFQAAAKAWPYGFRENARLARIMAKNNGRHNRAVHALDLKLKQFFINAYQSYLFNLVLARRIDSLDRVMLGDLAYKHETGSVFRVEDEAVENQRVAAKEISPTGPIFGKRMTQAEGEPGEIETAVLTEQDVDLEQFGNLRKMKVHGSRRPLRFFPEELEIDSGRDANGLFVELRFFLRAGCYATMLLREICKGELAEGSSDDYREESSDSAGDEE